MRLSLSFAFVLFSAFRLNEACGFEGAEGGKIPAVVGRASRAVKSRFTLRKPLKYTPSYYAQYDEEFSSSDAQVPNTESSGWSSSRKMRSAPASKKGLGAWYNATVEGVMEDVGASWFFNWRPSTWNANIVPPPGIEFVSMIQRGADVTPQNLEIVREEPAKALLTFNEPDHEEPRLSVAEALALWPLLETTGKLLGSPVTATKPLQSPWLSEFMYEAEKRNLRVDFLNVHYFNNSPDRWGTRIAVKDTEVFLENTYAYYKKPIWVTEWGLTQWLPDPPALIGVYPEPSVQAAFVKAASEMMNTLDYVERYAYFPLYPYMANSKAHMYNNDGSITVVGQAYKSVKEARSSLPEDSYFYAAKVRD